MLYTMHELIEEKRKWLEEIRRKKEMQIKVKYIPSKSNIKINNK